MKISLSPYDLAALTGIQNKAVYKIRHGCLLRITFESGIEGYADCHPWSEFGDIPLEMQLHHLRQGKLTPLLHRAIYFAQIDAEARSKGHHLFTGLTVPPSHFLIPNIEEWNTEQIESAVKEGFTCFKVKLGLQIEKEILQLKRLINLLSSHQCKLRLDFNLKLTQPAFLLFLKQIEGLKESIEFYEDPFVYNRQQWKDLQEEFKVSLACDYNSGKAINDRHSADFIVIKPAIQDFSIESFTSQQKIIYTSYLDHPYGQLCAAYVAAHAFQHYPKKIKTCGLLSHRAYQPNEFSSQFKNIGPVLSPPEGTGFGFDDLLKNLEWQTL